MTAAELIAALQHCPPDAPVYIESHIGYLVSSDLVPSWTESLRGIITLDNAGLEEVPERDQFFVYISSPY